MSLPSACEANLTPRQRQVLELIRQGKSNNEIAFALGIGLGTVKQHVVALFRKLKVTSRAMAVSRGRSGQLFPDNDSLVGARDVILARRPCIVLSMVLEAPQPDALRRLHDAMTRLAQAAGDIVFSRRGLGCDILLGIEQAEESDPVRALRCAETIFQTHARQDKPGGRIKGALAAGLAVASMFRRGGWSGEAIASSSIVLARQRAADARPETVYLDQTFVDLLRVCDAAPAAAPPVHLPLADPFKLVWRQSVRQKPISARLEECRQLIKTLASASPDRPEATLRGPAGSGKSWLCDVLAARLRQDHQSVLQVKCLPAHAPAPFCNGSNHTLLDRAGLNQAMAPSNPGTLLLLDNAHWLDRQAADAVVNQAVRQDFRVLRVLRGRTDADRSPGLALRPLQDDDVARHAAQRLKTVAANASLRDKAARAVAALAGGNPFFALELTRGPDLMFSLINDDQLPVLPLSIVQRVAAMLDASGLDRRLLNIVGQSDQGLEMQDLIRAMGENAQTTQETVDAARSKGVFRLRNHDRIVFAHPMHQRVTRYLGMDI